MNENVLMMRKAKSMLTDKWIHVALASLIYIVIMTALNSLWIAGLALYGSFTFGFYLYVACIADTGQNNMSLLFKGFDRFVETFLAGLIYSLAVALGLCLLIVPGIIVALGFSLTFYIMIDDPNISGLDAIQQSWNMMRGQKWNLFCLNIRFFGWILLSFLTCGIGFLFLSPYMIVTNLNFYRKVRYGVY